MSDAYRCEILLSHTSNTDFGFHQFSREPRIVQKQAIPHLKGLIALWLTDITEGQYISRRLLWATSTLIFTPVDTTGSFGVIWNCSKGH